MHPQAVLRLFSGFGASARILKHKHAILDGNRALAFLTAGKSRFRIVALPMYAGFLAKHLCRAKDPGWAMRQSKRIGRILSGCSVLAFIV
jgi:hypothetical protein